MIKSTIEKLYKFKRRIGKLRFIRSLKNQLLIEAKQKFREEKPEFGSFKDYHDALNKHLVSYSEYMYQYEFWKLNEAQRSEFISRAQVRCFYYAIPWSIKIFFGINPNSC